MTVLAAAGASATAAKKKTVSASKKSGATHRASLTSHKAAKAAPGKRTAAANRSAAANRKGKRTAVRRAVSWRNRQTTPTPERYREIQQALATKGYLQPDQATGVWDQNSTDALKRFQAGQNLDATGKINSLSLIALGLGPKHDTLPTQGAAADDSGR